LIVRHAERPSIPKDQIGDELMLTESGVQATKNFAKSLQRNVISIHSSPVLRCLQTAQLIAEVHNYNQTDIQVSCLLGDPGFLIEDATLAWQSWISKGSEAVNSHLLSGKGTWPGFRPFDQAVAEIHDYMLDVLSLSSSGQIIWVTHDTILAALVSRLLPQPITLSDWPHYLGSLEVTLGHDGCLKYMYSQY